MPRYQYSCKECKLTDVKQVQYSMEQKPICPTCKEELGRKFVRPPQSWFNQSRQGRE
jgi:putative FmdB family regulatory protein